MPMPLADILFAVLAATTVLIVIRMGAKRSGIPTAGWRLIVVGVGLFMLASGVDFIFKMLGAQTVYEGNKYVRLGQAVLGFGSGYVLLTVGLIRWLVGVFRWSRGYGHNLSGTIRHELRSSPTLLENILKSSMSGVLVLRSLRDRTGTLKDFEVRLVNPAAEMILGRTSGDLMGKPIMRQMPCLRVKGLLSELSVAIGSGTTYKSERYWEHGGSGCWYRIIAVKHGDGLAVTIGDISDSKRSEAQLRHAAQHDTLTGLPNRALFMESVAHALHRSKRFPDYMFAVLFLDFDRFKIINDSLGHEAGDQLLIGIAERLRNNLRAIDVPARTDGAHLPARLGGDEFVILLDGISGPSDAVRVAERLQVELSQPHVLDGHEVVSTASIGIVTSHSGYERSDDIVRDADTAMYKAKMAGKARHVVFDRAMHQEAVDRLTLERELREAVEREEFILEYEPIVSLQDGGRIVSFEALIRWPHPTRGRLMPDAFISVAEELRLIVPLGEWVLREATKNLVEWQQRFPEHADLSVSVNLSKQQLGHPDFVPMIRRVLADSGLAASCLWLEVTERMIMDDLKALRPTLDELRDLGVVLAIDDFGTGHSSLSCLHQLPINVLKIDRGFIDSVTDDRDYAAIVGAIVDLGHNLGLRIVAEGTEQQDHVELLRGMSCEFAQGRLFGPAMSPDGVAAALEGESPIAHAA